MATARRLVPRRSVVAGIVLTVITCGIYGFYWLVCLTDDMNTATGDEGTSGMMTLLLLFITCGIYGLYWAYKCGEKLDKARSDRGIPSSNGGVLYLILYLVCYVAAFALIQSELNKMAE